jgi:hypothetical protein
MKNSVAKERELALYKALTYYFARLQLGQSVAAFDAAAVAQLADEIQAGDRTVNLRQIGKVISIETTGPETWETSPTDK